MSIADAPLTLEAQIVVARDIAARAQGALDALLARLPQVARSEKAHISGEISLVLNELREATDHLVRLDALLQAGVVQV